MMQSAQLSEGVVYLGLNRNTPGGATLAIILAVVTVVCIGYALISARRKRR